MKKTTISEDFYVYAELNSAQQRAIQRRLKAGELFRLAPGVVTRLPPSEWPQLLMREWMRIMAALFPGAVLGYRSAFDGGRPALGGTLYLTYTYARKLALPGLNVQLVKGPGALAGDAPMRGLPLYFPSFPRLLLENLTVSRGSVRKSAGKAEVEARLIETCEARGEAALNRLRDQARELAPMLGLEREFTVLDALMGGVLGSRKTAMSTVAGQGLAASMPYDGKRLELFETLASTLRRAPMKQPANPVRTERAQTHFAFIEAYFSNFIEGTEFDIDDARRFVLEGQPIVERPKDSHDILGVFHQALDLGWANQVLASGEAALGQLQARHLSQMQARPEVNPGEFKVQANRAGNTEFVAPRLVRGTLVEGSRLLPSIPEGTARALYAMFLVSEVHPFQDGNGRLARLAMNAELSAVGACRIIVPTLFREEYLDCLRVLSREGNPTPFLDAMQRIHAWTAEFDYENLDAVIALLQACHAFEKSRIQFRLLSPHQLESSSRLG